MPADQHRRRPVGPSRAGATGLTRRRASLTSRVRPTAAAPGPVRRSGVLATVPAPSARATADGPDGAWPVVDELLAAGLRRVDLVPAPVASVAGPRLLAAAPTATTPTAAAPVAVASTGVAPTSVAPNAVAPTPAAEATGTAPTAPPADGSGDVGAVPARDVLRAAASAPDPSTRFPFRWVDPEAELDRAPAGPDLDDPDVDLAAMLPGPELAELLTQVDPAKVSDHALVELTAAAVRLTSWAQAVSSQLAAVLAQRDSMRPDWSVQNPRRADEGVVGEELAMRLAWSARRSAARLRRPRVRPRARRHR